MKIAVDFDKTIFDCNSRAYQFVNRFLPAKKSTALRYTPLNMLNKKDNLITKLYYKLFQFTHADKYTEYSQALHSINALKTLGHEVIILCSRPTYQLSILSIKDLAKMYNIDEKNIIVNCNNKIEYCKKFNIDLIIDNNIVICEEANRQGIDSICFTNKECVNIKSSHSWTNIIEYLSNLDQSENFTQNS